MPPNVRSRRFSALLPRKAATLTEAVIEAIKHPVVTGGIEPKTIGHAHGFFDAVQVLNVYNHRGKLGKMLNVSFHDALELDGKIVSAWVPTYS